MALAGPQKRQLRALGHKLPVVLTLGKAGLAPAAEQARQLLAIHELIKVRLPAGAPKERGALAEELARAAGAAVAGAVGRTVLLYKPNPATQPENRDGPAK